MGQEDSYRIRVSEGTKVLGTYYFNTERSPSSQIQREWTGSQESGGPVRLMCQRKHRFNIEVLDRGKVVLTRFILY